MMTTNVGTAVRVTDVEPGACLPAPTGRVTSEPGRESAAELLTRLRAEFLEMPGMRLTPEQIHRLCGVERTACRTLLDHLVGVGFLAVSRDGRYAVLSGTSRPRPAPHVSLRSRAWMCTHGERAGG